MNAYIKILLWVTAEMDILSSQGRCDAPVLNLAPHPSKQQMVAFHYLGNESKTVSLKVPKFLSIFIIRVALPQRFHFTKANNRGNFEKRSYV